MKLKLFFLTFLALSQTIFAQKKFQIIYLNEDYYTSIIADKNRKIIKKLDSSVYGLNFRPETLGYFSIFSLKDGNSEWTAIDINENRLFNVLNTEYGTPSPDYLIENKIRIIDENGKIWFTNKYGKIIIPRKLEQISSFHNGKAIIGENCKMIPWLEHPKENDCNHYSIKCEKHGFINKKGEIIEIGKYTFEQIADKIKWKSDYE